jgi:adenylate cyclase
MTHDMAAPDPLRPRDLLVDDRMPVPPSMSIAELAVGFADVCGFTKLSRFVDLPHLELVLRSFEEVCARALGDRAVIVKPVGDGVLFAMPEAEDAVDAAVQLVGAARASTVLPPVRVGLAFGWVLTRRHDCFGPAVNLASRLVSAAPAGAVVASETARDEARSRWRSWRRLPHRDLKGIGPVAAWEIAGAV